MEMIEPSNKFIAKDKSFSALKFGMRLNLGGSRHFYEGKFYEGKIIFSGDAGLFANITLSKNLSIQPEVLLESKGSKVEKGNFRTYSVSTPLNFLITTNKKQGQTVWAYCLVGGYYSYNFSGTVDGKSINFDKQFEHNEYGINYGFGFHVMKFQAGVYGKRGLTNLYQNNSSGEIYNKGSYFSLGYWF